MAVESAAVTYQFGEFEVDVRAYELRHRGERVRLARQPMDLLLLLLERPHELVSREEIAKRLWAPGVHTDLDAGIHTGILKIRQVLGDSRDSPRFVETVPGKGYRFVAKVAAVPPLVARLSAAPSSIARQPARETGRHNLPAELTSFVGRRRELAELPPLLASSRLLLLTGAGGVGKTRLAVRLAPERVEHFRDGVWLVDLSSLALPDLVAQTIASTLGFREGPQRSARAVLIDTLRDRELLLVLDTCEHLIGACADLVEALLREAPSLRVIATSREALGVAGEIVYRVPSLSLPEPAAAASAATSLDSEATQLFAERARTVDPTFAASPANAGAIARLCCRLDGIPLAIELAAARVAILSPEQIEGRLQDRFRLLTGGTRTAVARQRTLEATVDWSYGLLSEEERRLLSRLSVFPATWSMEAAEDVCSGDGIDRHQVLELLSRLVGKSLVVADSEYPDVGAIASSKRSDSTHANVWNRQATRVVRENGISSSSSPGFVACCRSSGTTISWRDSNEFDWNRKTFGALSTGRSRQRLTRTSVSSSLERCSGSGPNAACIPRENSGSDRRSPQPPVRRVRCGHAH